jgi:predicted enzyme related to lactoylglutathione lyase
VDAGDGWLIFALPPAEVACILARTDCTSHLMCADIEAALHELRNKGVDMKMPISHQPWGRIASISLPGGSELAIYEPKHPIPAH